MSEYGHTYIMPWHKTTDVIGIIDWINDTFGPSSGQWKIDFVVNPVTGANEALIFEFRLPSMLEFFVLRWR